MNSKSLSKVIVLCFDGATFDLIDPWVKEGKLPTLKQVMENGVRRILESTIPPISATAWATFLTGKNPGKHGIFEFRVIDPKTYIGLTETLVNSNSISGKTFIDYVSDHGLRVCSLFIPITYPPWKINGIMVSGTPTPDNTKAFTYPANLDFGVISPYSHRKMILTTEQKRLHGEYEANKRTQILCDAMKSGNYNLFLLHLHTADAAHHNYWRFFDPDCPSYSSKEGYGNFMLESYQILDNQLKKVLELMDDDASLLIISDHGGCRRPRKLFHLTSWLKKEGFIRVNKGNIKTVVNRNLIKLYRKVKPLLPGLLYKFSERNASIRKTYLSVKKNIGGIDWSKTQAYPIELIHPVVGIEINLKGRQSNGNVNSWKEYESLLKILTQKLLEIIDPETGLKIVEQVVRKEDLYFGENLDKAPDLIVFLNRDYDISDGDDSSLISNASPSSFVEKSGYHDLNGIFLAQGKPFKKNISLEKASLLDVPATILYLLGLNIPEDMDSKVMTDIFHDSFIKGRDIKYGKPVGHLDVRSTSVSIEEEEEMKKQLKGLGYLD